MELAVKRLPHRMSRDATLTIARFFWPGNAQRARGIIQNVLNLDRETVTRQLGACLRDFAGRYVDLEGKFDDHVEEACARIPMTVKTTDDRRHLIGAYFTMEYAYASAAFFNPSMVPSRVQDEVPSGHTRFVMSLRAVGEGHISSIVFRAGVLDRECNVVLDPVPNRSRRLRLVEDRTFEKRQFLQKLIEAGAYTEQTGAVLDQVEDTFTRSELTEALAKVRALGGDNPGLAAAADTIQWLAHSNYRIQAPPDTAVTEFVIFPTSENESNGIEDMRLVRFVDDDGSMTYYGTYTAYNGSCILPQLMEMRPSERWAEVHTLGGKYAVDKGMALFPRRIDGWYAMIARFDGKSLFLMTSDNIRFWNEAVLVQEPKYPWEFVQIGNCGSPIETEAGWLLITHGVGPMRRYCLGATLLDLRDPTKVVGRLAEPLLIPQTDESSGYVPNVVYSCGAMTHNGTLVIPYGISDVETGFATVPLRDLLEKLSG
jgi:predicted GH43/DUF377 family glycosyl hydrolase